MKFSIRDLLLVTVIVALALGWALDRVSDWGHDEALRADIDRLSSNVKKLKRLERLEAEFKGHKLQDLDWRVEFLTAELKKTGKEYDFGKSGTSAVTTIETLPDGSTKRTTNRYER